MIKLIGEKRGKLTVLSIANKKGKNGETYLCCHCACGKEIQVRANNFTQGKNLSCGCNRRKNAKSHKISFVLNNRPSDTKKVSADKREQGKVRQKIEQIREQHALAREFYVM